MAMIVTKTGGDPLNLKDWYGGFKAMLGVKRLKIAATTTPDAEDPNKTGNVTGDTDSDGYPDTDPNIPLTGGTTTPPTGGTTTPPASNTTAGKTAFDANCTSCHATPSRIMAAADPAKTRAAIDANKGGMGSLKSLTPQQIGDIAAYVATGG
jgi:mono/diheme cytochrome c family protein